MEENTQDVIKALDSSNSEQEVEQQGVNVESPTTETVEEETSTPLATEASETIPSDVDEMGVPYKNRYMESQRKLDKTVEELSQIKEILQAQSQGQQDKPTIGELQAFAQDTDNPQHKAWALNEIHKLQAEETSNLVKQEIEAWKKNQQVEQMKRDTFNAVISRNPEIAIRDNAGNFVGWNTKSPLFQKMNQYMANPRIASQPDALDIAEAYAIRDLARNAVPQVQQKVAQQKSQISNLQKQTMVEGAGNVPPPNVNPRQAAIEQAKSGTIQDAKVAMSEILKATGQIKSE